MDHCPVDACGVQPAYRDPVGDPLAALKGSQWTKHILLFSWLTLSLQLHAMEIPPSLKIPKENFPTAPVTPAGVQILPMAAMQVGKCIPCLFHAELYGDAMSWNFGIAQRFICILFVLCLEPAGVLQSRELNVQPFANSVTPDCLMVQACQILWHAWCPCTLRSGLNSSNYC